MDRNAQENFPMFFEPSGGDGERLADDRLRRIFEGPVVQGLGVLDCELQRGHSRAMVQAVLDDVLNGKVK